MNKKVLHTSWHEPVNLAVEAALVRWPVAYKRCVNPATLPHVSAPLFLSRAKEQQKEADDSGLSTKCKEDEQQYHTDPVGPPCPYLAGHRHPHVARPARVLSPVMEEEMKRNEGVAKGGNILVSKTTLEAEVVSCVG